MRAKLTAATLVAVLALSLTVCVESQADPTTPIVLHPGDGVTLADLYGYLAALPQPGDWVRVRSSAGGAASVVTTGFGAETVAGKRTLWIETRVDTQTVSGAGLMMAGNSTPPVVSKTYIAGDSFAPFGTTYEVIATVAAIGDKVFRMNDRAEGTPSFAPSIPATTYSLADGLPFAGRSGTVLIAEPKDMTVAGVQVHATHLVVAFSSASAAGVSVPATLVENWQSPDVPLGTVASSGTMLGVRRSNTLVGFGHGNYRSAIGVRLDALRSQVGNG